MQTRHRFSGTGAFALAKALLSVAKYVQLSRFRGNHFCDCLFSRLENGQAEPVTALAVRVRLR